MERINRTTYPKVRETREGLGPGRIIWQVLTDDVSHSQTRHICTQACRAYGNPAHKLC